MAGAIVVEFRESLGTGDVPSASQVAHGGGQQSVSSSAAKVSSLQLSEDRPASHSPALTKKLQLLKFVQDGADIFVLAVVLTIFLVLDNAVMKLPFIATADLYRYSYPAKATTTVPSWVDPITSFILPISCFTFFTYCGGSKSFREMYRLVITLAVTVLLAGSIAKCMQVAIARPSPHFVYGCWSSGVPVWSSNNTYGGYPKCDTTRSTYEPHLQSFPSGEVWVMQALMVLLCYCVSGRTAVSAAGLGFMTLYMLGQMKVYAGNHHIWCLVISLIPSLGSVTIGISLITDNWRHPGDIIVGLILGFLLGFGGYRHVYPTLTHQKCNVPLYQLYKQAANVPVRRRERTLPITALPPSSTVVAQTRASHSTHQTWSQQHQ